ncbi:MAG: sensor histidine kinase [Acidimicrobiales bacterium]
MSLRTRLVIAVGVVAVVALVIADIATHSALQSFLYQRIDQQLEQQHGRFELQVKSGRTLRCLGEFGPGPVQGAPGGPIPGQEGTIPGQGGASAANAFDAAAIEVRTPSGTSLKGCPVYVGSVAYTPELPTTIGGLSAGAPGQMATYFTTGSTKPNGPAFRVRASTLDNGDLLILALPLTETASTLHQLLLIELAVTGGAVLVALVGGFWLVRLGLRPLRDMETTAESIAAGNLTERVPGENQSTEVGRLAGTLNLMLTRIEAAFSARLASERRLRASEQQLRQFVADASHELRTPIAAISAYAELFERGASDQKEDLGRLLGGIRTETIRMEQLVADLLLLARLDEGWPMEQRSVDLVALCAEAVHTASTVGPGWPVTFTASAPVEVVGDATRLRQVMDNLLGNVRAHTPPGTPARITVGLDGGEVVVTVADDGPGMDPEESGHVFERFYRSDPSRSRAHGGAGLGLSIVSAIVTAHHGTVAAEGRPGSGTTFTVRLPLTPPTVEPARDVVVVAGP